MSDPDEDVDFVYYGTPLEDEQESFAGQRRKEVLDPSATRRLPVSKQEVTDAEGRRRFHGAFTGGYSAGYYNTVGSKDGWAPSTFKSSRAERATAQQQSVSDFLDEDELQEAQGGALTSTAGYDTFGSRAAAAAREHAQQEAQAAAARGGGAGSAGPGLILPGVEKLLAPVVTSTGQRLLQGMGWRMGKGVGRGGEEPEEEDEEEEGEGKGDGKKRRRRRLGGWGRAAGVSADNTPLYLLRPKTDMHGLGFDPFKGAEEFREARKRKQQQQEDAAAGPGAVSKRARRGVAFGTGVLEEDDTYGLAEDYIMDDAQDRPSNREAFHYEIASDEEEEHAGPMGAFGRSKQQQPFRIGPSSAAPLQLQATSHFKRDGALIPRFVLAKASITLEYFPPPRVPREFDGRHRFPAKAQPPAPGVLQQPQVPPPADPALRRAIETLAVFVARGGPQVERLARQRQQEAAAAAAGGEGGKAGGDDGEGAAGGGAAGGQRYTFLHGGEGAAYYRWRLAYLRSLMGGGKAGGANPAQRSAPLTADDRGDLLGEEQLPGAPPPLAPMPTIATTAGLGEGGAAAAAAAARGQPLLKIAEADRQRLQQALGGNFVRASEEEMGKDGMPTIVPGLRPGAAAPTQAPVPASTTATATTAAAAAAAAAPRLPLGISLSFQSGGVELPGAMTQLPGTAAAAAGAGGGGGDKPKRRVEEWRPAPLLCRRLNVADPYKGRPMELQVSKFKSDYLALPETAAAASAAAASAAQAHQQREAAAAVAATAAATQTLPPPPLRPPAAAAAAAAAAAPPRDAADMANDFLESLGMEQAAATTGNAAAALPIEAAATLPPPPPLPPGGLGGGPAAGQGAGGLAPAGELDTFTDKPIDLFKAIFEADDDDDDEEEGESTKEDRGALEETGTWEGERRQQAAEAAGAAAVGSAGRGEASEKREAPSARGGGGPSGEPTPSELPPPVSSSSWMKQRRAESRWQAPPPSLPGGARHRSPSPEARASAAAAGGDRAEPKAGEQGAPGESRGKVMAILEALRGLSKKKKKDKKKKKKERGKEKNKKKKGRDKGSGKHKKERKSAKREKGGSGKRGGRKEEGSSDGSSSSSSSSGDDSY